MNNSPLSVSISGLGKRFGPTVVLDGVDASFAPGVNGLLGPNGAGKTTLMRILATVLSADRGHLEVLGSDPTTTEGGLAVRRRLGYLPQEPGFHRHLSAFDFVDYVAILKECVDRKGATTGPNRRLSPSLRQSACRGSTAGSARSARP